MSIFEEAGTSFLGGSVTSPDWNFLLISSRELSSSPNLASMRGSKSSYCSNCLKKSLFVSSLILLASRTSAMGWISWRSSGLITLILGKGISRGSGTEYPYGSGGGFFAASLLASASLAFFSNTCYFIFSANSFCNLAFYWAGVKTSFLERFLRDEAFLEMRSKVAFCLEFIVV